MKRQIYASYWVAGAVRILLKPGDRKKGEPLNQLSIGMQKAALPLTRAVDKLLKVEKEVGQDKTALLLLRQLIENIIQLLERFESHLFFRSAANGDARNGELLQ